MDINGLTPQQNGLRVASGVGASSGPPPPVSENTSTPSAPAPVVPDVEPSTPSAASALLAQSQTNVRSSSRIHVDAATERFVIEILNENHEIIKQIPLEEALEIAEQLQRVTGLIFDQDA